MPGLGDGGQEAGGGRGGGEWAGRAAAGMDQVTPASLRPDEVDNKYKLFFIPITIFFPARQTGGGPACGGGGRAAGGQAGAAAGGQRGGGRHPHRALPRGGRASAYTQTGHQRSGRLGLPYCHYGFLLINSLSVRRKL